MTAPRSTASAAVTALVVVAAALAVLAVLTGRVSLIVTHGVSMEPLYHQGDLVVAMPADTYRVGDIIAFDRTQDDGGTLEVLHRVIASDVDGFTTRGDNNTSTDPGVVALHEVHGRAVLHVPRAGAWVALVGSPVSVGVVALGSLLLGLGGRRRRGRARRTPSARGRTATASAVARARRAGMTSALEVGVVVVLAAMGTGLAVSGWAAPEQRETAPTTTETDTRTASLSYTAAVRPSPVYDTPVVSSPTPVFRAVATRVDVDLAYQGVPGEGGGSVALRADLASPGGWTATVPLTTATRYSGGEAAVVTPLDLAALVDRAEAAAEVTGLAAEPLAVTVVAVVNPDGADPGADPDAGGPLRVTMALTLTGAQLVASGDGSESTSRASVPRASASAVSAVGGEVALLGLQLPVRSVRVVAVVLLLLSGAGGALVARRARRSAAVTSEADRVAARIGDRLVAVAPPSGGAGGTSGSDVAASALQVADPLVLVRLAAAHEAPVLHWRNGAVGVFAVSVGGTWYSCTAAAVATQGAGGPSTGATGPVQAAVPRAVGPVSIPRQRGPAHALRR